MTAPTAADALARVVVEHYACGVDMTTPRQYTARGGWTVTCTCGEPVGESGDDDIEDRHARHFTAAVVAAVRAMTAEQLVDLRPDLTVEGFCLPGGCVGGPNCGKVRIVGPWRYTP